MARGARKALPCDAPPKVRDLIPTSFYDETIDRALEHSELSPCELAVRFTDEKGDFIS